MSLENPVENVPLLDTEAKTMNLQTVHFLQLQENIWKHDFQETNDWITRGLQSKPFYLWMHLKIISIIDYCNVYFLN